VGGPAAEALGRAGNETLAGGLLGALSHKDSFVREKAAQFIGYYSSENQTFTELSRLAGADPVNEVREAAVQAIDTFRRKMYDMNLVPPP
jgi:HEAT repeat protein